MVNVTKEAVALVFEANPGYSTLYFTSDGQSFLTENYARQYVRDLDNKDITPIEREAEFSETENTPAKPIIHKADELIALINKAATLEELDAVELPEGEKRATVIKAFAAKKVELGAI